MTTPEKARLYRTATLAYAPLGMQAGQIVSVRYFEHVYNAMSGKREPVYSVSSTQAHGPSSPLLFEGALRDFVF